MNPILLSLLISNGTFQCVKGNEPSICEQKIKFYQNYISVIYDGDCAGQGPYRYFCAGNYCQDDFGVITFNFLDKDNYFWENKQYGFYCEFKRVK
jgi:hypothetical protein